MEISHAANTSSALALHVVVSFLYLRWGNSSFLNSCCRLITRVSTLLNAEWLMYPDLMLGPACRVATEEEKGMLRIFFTQAHTQVRAIGRCISSLRDDARKNYRASKKEESSINLSILALNDEMDRIRSRLLTFYMLAGGLESKWPRALEIQAANFKRCGIRGIFVKGGGLSPKRRSGNVNDAQDAYESRSLQCQLLVEGFRKANSKIRNLSASILHSTRNHSMRRIYKDSDDDDETEESTVMEEILPEPIYFKFEVDESDD
eukprot:scaffold7667_cov161-Amphora_coffeaeformis.AAC.6